ncbi:hypothetical protein OHQ88_34035 (plasmid) [Micromonospora zamorensis]|uniref:hypothetical protein n=1 Tax=Micromonospora zamorensis TaxID=709883 RepID=UPI002E1E3577
MPASPTHSFNRNDLVVIQPDYARVIDRGVIYKVVRLLPVNIEIMPVGGGKAWRVAPHQIQPAPTGAQAIVDTIPYQPPLHSGQVVTVAGPGWKEPAEKLWVVLKEKGDGKVSLALLGGAGGRYWPSVPRGWITPVEIASVVLKPREEAKTSS